MANRPASITIILYEDGRQFKSFALSGNNLWRWQFEVPRYNRNGQVIVWTVDEEYVANYRKSVNGTNITNTHISVPDPDGDGNQGFGRPGPGTGTGPGGAGNLPQMGDNLMLALWIALAVGSAIGLVVLTVVVRRARKRAEIDIDIEI